MGRCRSRFSATLLNEPVWEAVGGFVDSLGRIRRTKYRVHWWGIISVNLLFGFPGVLNNLACIQTRQLSRQIIWHRSGHADMEQLYKLLTIRSKQCQDQLVDKSPKTFWVNQNLCSSMMVWKMEVTCNLILWFVDGIPNSRPFIATSLRNAIWCLIIYTCININCMQTAGQGRDSRRTISFHSHIHQCWAID